MAHYVRRPRRDEVRIGRGLSSATSELGCTEVLDLCIRVTFCDEIHCTCVSISKIGCDYYMEYETKNFKVQKLRFGFLCA